VYYTVELALHTLALGSCKQCWDIAVIKLIFWLCTYQVRCVAAAPNLLCMHSLLLLLCCRRRIVATKPPNPWNGNAVWSAAYEVSSTPGVQQHRD
jgi:hypothetical protein